MAQGLINNGVSVTKDFSPNEYQLLADYTVSGSAITSYTFSGLNINADEEVVLVSDMSCVVSGNPQIFIYVNSISTGYYSQVINAGGTSIVGIRTATSDIGNINLNEKALAIINIKLTNNGYFVYQNNYTRPYNTTLPTFNNWYGTSTFTLSQINSLTISASVASAIGIGSRFQLYKVKGQVQQTWATT